MHSVSFTSFLRHLSLWSVSQASWNTWIQASFAQLRSIGLNQINLNPFQFDWFVDWAIYSVIRPPIVRLTPLDDKHWLWSSKLGTSWQRENSINSSYHSDSLFQMCTDTPNSILFLGIVDFCFINGLVQGCQTHFIQRAKSHLWHLLRNSSNTFSQEVIMLRSW